MLLEENSLHLSRELSPLCSRHDYVMSYEKDGVAWTEEFDTEMQTLDSYHCGYSSCTVHYAHTEGYFTVVDTLNIPHFIEEPGINLLSWPRHSTWLYQCRADSDARRHVWRCEIEICDYSHPGNVRSGIVDQPIT